MNQVAEREIDRSQMKVSDEVAIQITGMNKWYGAFHVLKDIDLTVQRGERIVVCGPSGSGKSTLIRCMNGLEAHQSGTLDILGLRVGDDTKVLASVLEADVEREELLAEEQKLMNETGGGGGDG